MKKFVSDDLKLLDSLSLFSRFKKEDLEQVIDVAHVSKIKKAQNIFFAEDKISSFYIVVDGAVKLTVIDEDGNEAVLQIVERGGLLNDVFSDRFQTSAQAMKDSVLLTFSIDRAVDLLNKVPAFGLMILKETAKRNRLLVDKLSSMRISDSKQKVGQFLLEMAFEEGAKKSKTFDLKYEKSAIASYLGINPETLSRTLQKLKDLGEITVDKNKITLLKIDSLCDYCNSEIAGKCSSRQSDFCKH
jgi:CRP-like cAMP-binding protein